MPYEEGPYLDRQAKSQIKQLGTCLAMLDIWDRSRIVDGAIARRAASRKILSLVPDQPYVNRALKQIINSATNPNYDARYSSANDMINALNSLHFPNWKAVDGSYYAENWNGWDWVVETITKRTGTEIVIKRSRIGNSSFRRWSVEKILSDAFSKVLRDG